MADKIIRMRCVKDCVEYIKSLDKDTAITEWYIRTLCKNNIILNRVSGKKLYVNLDHLIAYINFETYEEKGVNVQKTELQ